MENFYIGHTRTVEFSGDDYHYDGAWVDGGVLHDGATAMALPFAVLYFRNLQYDYLLVSPERVLYRINKCRLVPEEVGVLHDRVVAVEACHDAVVVVTEKEMFVFNTYFELLRSRAHGMPAADGCRLVWADGMFCLATPGRTSVFDMDLEVLGTPSLRIASAAFIGKYNKFACAAEGAVRFVEPNGLEHGDPLPVACDSVALLRVDDSELLLAVSGERIEVYYMRNFHWYRKMAVSGVFLGCRRNAIVLRGARSVVLLHVYRELSSGFVVDGRALKYTNLSASLIPPPYFYKELVFDAQVDAYACADGLLCVLAGGRVHRYRVDGDCFFAEGVSDAVLPGAVNEMLVHGERLLLRCANGIYGLGGMGPVCLARPRGAPVVKICSAGRLLGVLLADGGFGWMDLGGACELAVLHRFRLDIHRSFRLDAPDAARRVYLLSGGVLQATSGAPGGELLVEGASSFLVHAKYLLCVCGDRLSIREGGKVCAEACVDPGQALLAVYGNRIISQTRFGSLETTTSMVFSSALAREHIAAGRYGEAAGVCDRNHIGYEVFYSDGRCPAALLDVLDDRQVLALVSLLKVDGPVLHEHDSLERLRRAFRADADAADWSSDVFIRDSSVRHLFGTPYRGRLFALEGRGAQEDVSEDVIDCSEPVASLNRVLRRLRPDRHAGAIVGLFVGIGRTDLCFYLPELPRVAKMLLGLVSASDVIRASIATLSLEKIVAAYKACQSDHLPFAAFYRSRANLAHSLYDYLEDRANALYHLVDAWRPDPSDAADGELPGEIAGYVEKHGLFDELLMYQRHGLFEANFYLYVAQHCAPSRAFGLYLLGGDRRRALEVGCESMLWREVLGEFADAETRERIAGLLVGLERHAEAGEVYDEHLMDYERAIGSYMRGGSYGRAVAAWRKLRCAGLARLSVAEGGAADAGRCGGADALLLASSKLALKNEIAGLEQLVGALESYKERLGRVRQRLGENAEMSQASHSCQSLKSVRNALLKDRPGGAYEHEYVLNKLRELVVEIVEWRSRTEHLLDVFGAFGLDECAEAYVRASDGVRGRLRGEVERLWSFRRDDYDPGRPVVDKPVLTAYFE